MAALVVIIAITGTQRIEVVTMKSVVTRSVTGIDVSGRLVTSSTGTTDTRPITRKTVSLL